MHNKQIKAKNILEKQNASCVFIDKNNKEHILFGNGIRPLYNAIKEDKTLFQGAVVADKIIGKASALLLSYAGVEWVYGKTMSQSAIKVFMQYNIAYEYEIIVPFIKNRQGNDLCPMEKNCSTIENGKAAFDFFASFFNQ